MNGVGVAFTKRRRGAEEAVALSASRRLIVRVLASMSAGA